MIKAEHISKIYNKNKANKTTALFDITMTLPDKGLVALFGESGSGKSTLLNIIGGIDNPTSGKITIDGETVKYHGSAADEYRCEKTGFIFQNYNLIADKTVLENVMLSLKLAGIDDKDEREKRALCALELTGIKKYKNRLPGTLSGGEQQRVAIARAIVKRPQIIIADEPTGNLDEKNTLQIMDILRQISKTCLVILVTHEKNLVDFYADYVIALTDGKIYDSYVNEKCEVFNKGGSSDIYLKDLNIEEIDNNGIHIDFYSDNKTERHNLTIACVNGKYYIQSDINAIVINNKSGTKLINDSRKSDIKKQANTKDVFDETMLTPIAKPHKKAKYMSFLETLKTGYKNMLGRNKKRSKWSNFAFFLLAFIIVVNCSSLYTKAYIQPSEYNFGDDNTYAIVSTETHRVDMETIDNILDTDDDKILFSESVLNMLFITAPVYYQNNIDELYLNYNYFISNKNGFNGKLIYSMPETTDTNNIILSRGYIENMISNDGNYLKEKGFSRSKDFLGKIIAVENGKAMTICGIADDDSQTIWMDSNTYMESVFIPALKMYEPLKNFEGMTQKELYKYYLENFHADNYSFYLSTLNIDKYTQIFGNNYSLKIASESKFETLKEEKLYDSIVNIISISFTLLFGIIIEFFVMKVETFGRISHIGMLRCIGVSRKEIVGLFAAESFAISTITSLMGVICGWIASEFMNMVNAIMYSVSFPSIYILVIFIAIVFINMLFGILPALSITRRTPAQILAKYDI